MEKTEHSGLPAVNMIERMAGRNITRRACLQALGAGGLSASMLRADTQKPKPAAPSHRRARAVSLLASPALDFTCFRRLPSAFVRRLRGPLRCRLLRERNVPCAMCHGVLRGKISKMGLTLE